MIVADGKPLQDRMDKARVDIEDIPSARQRRQQWRATDQGGGSVQGTFNGVRDGEEPLVATVVADQHEADRRRPRIVNGQ